MHLDYRTAGAGPPVLLIHGGAEDAGMLTGQADALAATRRVIWYDRRGTGASTRDDWPGSGADQHADDAAMLLRELGAVPATVLGFSSGGIVALALAARHPELVTEAIAWEPPAVAMLPDGEQMRTALHEPYEEHLRRRPGDWRGAYHVLLRTLSQGRADLDSPIVKLAEANAEAVLRDDGPLITARTFRPGELPPGKVIIALSETPNPLHEAIGIRLGELTGQAPLTVKGADSHEVYLEKPQVIADFLESRKDMS
ncbi:alpha/beta fold hydrolase [Actinoplanes aureus]|uniref:Alpha/beta hydrolase n=1 Tax=Actinoplanes aureus TaxID=2792083 RepID=A0A931CGZ4_9ACTN|nr:alpha/beta hydrolase [Actinoplanes aureus]MBG0567083.1 alpha/beta hydrolase [Actinoplanes aureus]